MDVDRILALKRRREQANARTQKLKGALEASRTRFQQVVKEIQDAGYDPRTLKAVLVQKEAELQRATDQFEADLAVAEAALSAVESQAETAAS